MKFKVGDYVKLTRKTFEMSSMYSECAVGKVESFSDFQFEWPYKVRFPSGEYFFFSHDEIEHTDDAHVYVLEKLRAG